MSTVLFIAMILLFVFLFGAINRPTKRQSGTKINEPEKWKTCLGNFTVATYNIQSGKGLDGKRDLSRSRQIIKDIDIVGLQELRGSTWWGQAGQINLLTQPLECGWFYFAARLRWFREYRGNALLSHFPVESWERIPLIDISGKSYRNISVVKVRIEGFDLWVLNTHLNTCLARELQLQEVITVFSKFSPAILMGDLNTTRDNPQLAKLLTAPDVIDAINLSMGQNDEPERVDWILAKGLKVIRGEKVERGVSDHPCYIITFDLLEAKEQATSDKTNSVAV